MEGEWVNLNEWVRAKVSHVEFIVKKLLTREIKLRYENLRFLILEKIDPSPPPRKKDTTDNWYSRIDYKYALRNARWKFHWFSYLDYMYEPLRVPEFFETYSKRSQKILNPLVRIIGIRHYESKQRYQALLDKKNN